VAVDDRRTADVIGLRVVDAVQFDCDVKARRRQVRQYLQLDVELDFVVVVVVAVAEDRHTPGKCSRRPRLDSCSTTLRITSGVGTGGSGGSMNRGPRAPAAPSSGATEKF